MSFIKRFTTPNIGGVDRVLRALPALVVAALWAAGVLEGTLLVVAAVVAGMLLLTAITGLCSIYALLGVSTRRAP